ncbi:MAG: cation:proton antiporter [Kiritimatiellae bacterium]|nr:cation:proton antiporter [Kiritimatiellia bacterium]
MTHAMARLVLQLSVLLIAARLGGFLFHRYLKGPGVLGELFAGMIIGPYALGGLNIPGWGVLFPAGQGLLPVSPELYGIATVASILLLFLSGLDTDVAMFLRYSAAGLAVGLGGVVFSFLLGALSAVAFRLADSLMAPTALFLGAIATATSVGLTARILSEKKKMSTPEGVTILTGAVLDDVLGVVLLAIVVGMVKLGQAGGRPDWGQIGLLAGKAVGFWLFFTAAGLLLARRISRLLKMLRSRETIASICLGLALLLAGLSEMAGLAMIIGAYIMGLSLSRTDLVHELQDQLQHVYNFLVPIFFCVMGMLVNFADMKGMLFFGVVYSIVAIAAKVGGCALPAWLMGFTRRGALRVGIGMAPRAEVAMIIAGIGLSSGAIASDTFGASIMMVVVSMVVVPPLLVKAFEGGSGLRGEERVRAEEVVTVNLALPAEAMAEFLCSRIARAFRHEEFFVHRLHTDASTYEIRKEYMAFSLVQEGPEITLNMPARYQHVARLIVLEEVLTLQELLDSVKQMKSPGAMGAELLDGLYGGKRNGDR